MSVCSVIVLTCMVTLGLRDTMKRLQRELVQKPHGILIVIAGLVGLYAVYSMGARTADSRTIAIMTAYLGVPFVLLNAVRGSPAATWLDAATILWIWLPIELGMIRALLTSAGTNSPFNYAFAQGLAVNMGLIAFAAWRRFPGIGYRFAFSPRDVLAAVISFLLFGAIAIPLGLAIHFIQYSFEPTKLLIAPVAFFGIYLTIAVPEELLFRGLIQNWCERMTRRKPTGLIIGSIIFGISHLNNGRPIPNYRYFLMASVAGIFYGAVWRRSGSIAISAITHALVDSAWSVFFR